MIKAPKHPRSHPDRGVHAEEAIEASFDALADRAVLMGWTRDEAAFALLNSCCCENNDRDILMRYAKNLVGDELQPSSGPPAPPAPHRTAAYPPRRGTRRA